MALEWLLDDAEQRCMAGIEREEAFRQGQEVSCPLIAFPSC